MKRYIEQIEGVKRLLTEEVSGDFTNGKLYAKRHPEDPSSITVDEAPWPSIEELGQLLSEMKKVKATIFELEKEISEAGLEEYLDNSRQ